MKGVDGFAWSLSQNKGKMTLAFWDYRAVLTVFGQLMR